METQAPASDFAKPAAASSATANSASDNDGNDDSSGPRYVLVAKYGKERIELPPFPPSATIGRAKEMLSERTGILPKRQKLIGLTPATKGKKGAVGDDTPMSDLKVKGGKGEGPLQIQFILMGTPEERIFVDPSDRDDLPDVVDDFDLDFSAGSEQWVQHVAKEENLQKFTESTAVHIIHEPRPNKPLLVLDLDHTLLDFSSKALSRAATGGIGDEAANKLKRPYMDEFLTWSYKHYDLVVWSQTSWRWLEVKLTELGMLSHPGYKICFVLDKTSMFQIVSTNRSGKKFTHSVKPMQIIWSKFPRWGENNTVHIDDLSRNFALNLRSGLKCTAYYRNKKRKDGAGAGKRDAELLGIGRFLELLATTDECKDDFTAVDFRYWQDYVGGKRSFSGNADGKM